MSRCNSVNRPTYIFMCVIISYAGSQPWPLCMWSPLMEVGSGNLALLHCSCLNACLAAYSNILRRDLNTTCITINRVMWRHSREPIRKVWLIHGCFWSKASVKVEIKTTREVVNICEVLWSAPLNTSKMTWNRQEDSSSQWEATKKSVGPSTARVIVAHRDRYQRQWTANVRHLICVRRMRLDGRYRSGDRHRDTSLTVEVVWR